MVFLRDLRRYDPDSFAALLAFLMVTGMVALLTSITLVAKLADRLLLGIGR